MILMIFGNVFFLLGCIFGFKIKDLVWIRASREIIKNLTFLGISIRLSAGFE